MPGFDPARTLDIATENDRLVLHLARFVIAVLVLGSVIAGMLC